MADDTVKASRRVRVPYGSITREQLIDAAEEEILAGRYEEMSIRRLAVRIGAAPMSLYRHVRDKEDLLNEVVDRMLARTWEPAVDPSDTSDWLLEAADRLRQFLVDQPAALEVFLAHPVTTPANRARVRAMLDVLESAGLDEESARQVFATLQTYTIGFAAVEASRARWLAEQQEPADPEMAWLASMTGREQFAAGLRALLGV